MLLSNKILDDDLFVVIGARPQSVSFNADMSEMPNFLQRYFSQNNIMVIYPEQFGEVPALTSFVDPMASDIATLPSPWLRRLHTRLAYIAARFVKPGRRRRRSKIEL